MIKAYTPINNLEYTVYKPIIANLVKSFATKYLKNPDIFVEYQKDIDRFGEGIYDTNYANQYNKQWLRVDYEISHDDSYMLTNNLRGNDGIRLLTDPEIDYYISTIPITHKFNVTIKIYDKFKNRLVKLLNSFKLGELNDTNYLILNADVFFTIPSSIVALTNNIVNLKYGGTVQWDDYINKFSLIPLDKLLSKDGKKYTLAYKIQYRDIAVWTEIGFLDKEINIEDNGFSLELNMAFSFDLVTDLEVEYPILVCNKPINKEYLLISETLIKKYALPIERSLFDSLKINTITNFISNKIRNDVNKLLEHMDLEPYMKLIEDSPELLEYGETVEEIIENSVNLFIENMYNLNYNLKRIYPIYDVWRGYIEYDRYEPVGVMLLQIDEGSRVYLNLYELMNLGYSKEFIDYLIDNKEKFLNLYQGFFHFNICMNRDFIAMNELDIVQEDMYIEELDLELKRGDIYNKLAIEQSIETGEEIVINTLKYYHFVLYIATDPSFIPNYSNEEISLLLQYVSMDRIKDLGKFLEETPMKTVMQFSLLAFNTSSKPKLIDQILKDIMNS